MCIYIYIYIHIYICIDACIYIYIYIYTYVCPSPRSQRLPEPCAPPDNQNNKLQDDAMTSGMWAYLF